MIAESLKDLSDGIDPVLRAEGEQTLVGACGSWDPAGLGRLGPVRRTWPPVIDGIQQTARRRAPRDVALLQ